MSDLYENNENFKEYVDRYCMIYRYSVEQALTHAIIKHVADFYVKGW